MTLQVDYHVLSGAGALMATFANQDRALGWAKAKRREFPGIGVKEVTTVVTERTVYKSRIALRAVG